MDNFSFLIVLYLGMRFQVNFFISVVNILSKAQTIPSSHTILFVPVVSKDSVFLHVPTNTCYCQFGYAHPNKCEMASQRGSISVSWWLVMLILHLNIYWPLKIFFRKTPVHFHFKWSYLIDDVKPFLFGVSSLFVVFKFDYMHINLFFLFYQAVDFISKKHCVVLDHKVIFSRCFIGLPFVNGSFRYLINSECGVKWHV